MPKGTNETATWNKARKKIGDILESESVDPELALKAIATLVKMKAVELKMSEADFGAEFKDD